VSTIFHSVAALQIVCFSDEEVQSAGQYPVAAPVGIYPVYKRAPRFVDGSLRPLNGGRTPTEDRQNFSLDEKKTALMIINYAYMTDKFNAVGKVNEVWENICFSVADACGSWLYRATKPMKQMYTNARKILSV